MALIWVREWDDPKTLARLWQEKVFAQSTVRALTDADEADPAELGIAVRAARNAQQEYDAAVTRADSLAKASSKDGLHACLIGVGHYADKGIKNVTTSVHGAHRLLEFLVTDYASSSLPLASIELLLSPPSEMGEWIPSDSIAEKLGIDPRTEMPADRARFDSIHAAFGRLLARAGGRDLNGIFWYFSGHGVWRGNQILLAEDAVLPGGPAGAANMIDLANTLETMHNAKPAVQCFFTDACQEITPDVVESMNATPGKTLREVVDAPALEKRDMTWMIGSKVGKKAYGPADEAPFFTQELIEALRRRGAKWRKGRDTWMVTTGSLWEALEVAGTHRGSRERQRIEFTIGARASTYTANLCEIKDRIEVFLRVVLEPTVTFGTANVVLIDATNAQVTVSTDEIFVVPGGTYRTLTTLSDPALSAFEEPFVTTTPVHRHSIVIERSEETRP